MKTGSAFDNKKTNSMIAAFVKAQGYDPSSLISTREYLDLVIKILNLAQLHLAGEPHDDGRMRGGSPLSDSILLGYVQKDRSETSQEEVSRRLLSAFEQQDELLFIQRGSDISYYPIWYRFPAHYHRNAYFDVAYVFSGTARFYFPDLKTVDLEEGGLLVIPPESTHGECAVSENTDAITCSIRSSAFLETFLSIFDENALLQSFFQRMLTGSSAISYLRFDTRNNDGSADGKIRHLFCALMEEQDESRPYFAKVMDSLMGQIFAFLLRDYERQMSLPESLKFLWKPEYDALFHYIENHITEHITLESLADQFHYSRRQLMRIIKECTGQSYSELVKSSRMRLAKELLSGTELSASEIASRCGYENLSSFSRAFTDSENLSPARYRSHAKKDQ